MAKKSPKVTKKLGKSATKKAARRKTSDRLKKNLIKDIVRIISGLESERIVDLLYGRENVNEFDIAKRLKLTINQARNILYKLTDYGLVSFTRKKDKKNGGWYTYFWTLDTYKSLSVLQTRIRREIEAVQSQLQSRNTKRFYHCENCDIEMTEENALVQNFVCPECGEVFKLKDNTEAIGKLDEHLQDAKKRFGIVAKEIVAVEEHLEILRLRRQKVALRKAKAKRKLAAVLRKKALLEKKEEEEKNKPKITKKVKETKPKAKKKRRK